MTQVFRRYTREFTLAMLFYIIAVPVVILLLPRAGDSLWRYALVLVPVVPLFFGLRAYLRALNGIDELQQRIHLAGIAFAAGATGIITFTWGWLEVAGFPPLPLIWIFPMMIMLWGLGLALADRRYQ